MSLFPAFLAALFPSAPRHVEEVPPLPEVTVFRAQDIPADLLPELRHVDVHQWRDYIHARHVAEEWGEGLSDEALGAWVGGEER